MVIFVEQDKKKDAHSGHRDRMREKYINKGIDIFDPHEILEILLFYAIPRKNTNDIAHKLIDACGSFSAVFDASIDTLMQCGLSFSAAALLHMIPELSGIYQSDKFSSEAKIVTDETIGERVMQIFGGRTEACIHAFFLDAKGREKYSGIISKGDVSDTSAFIKDVVSIAASCEAIAVIISHNHVGGEAFPSKGDVRATEDLSIALSTIGVRLADHVIIAGDKYISLAASPIFSIIFEDRYYD